MKTKVCSLELSRKLAEAGIVVETEFVWVNPNGDEWRVQRRSYANPLKETIPAPLACELGEVLPNEIDDGTGNYFLFKSGHLYGYRDCARRFLFELQGQRNVTEAFGRIALWAKENGHLEEAE